MAGNTEELGIRMSATGVVETTSGVNLTGKAVENLGQKLDEAGKQGAKLDAGARTGAAGAKVAETAARELADQLGRTIPVTGQLGETLQTLGGDGAAAVARMATAGGALSAVMAPLAVLGAAVGVAWMQGRIEAQRYFQALTLTGNAAGVTSAQMGDMARRIDGVAGTQRQASEALAQIASTGKVAGSTMEAVGLAAVQMERITGQSVQKTVGEFAALGNDPVKAVRALNESTNFLTVAVYDQVKALAEQGNETAAASVAQKAYADALLPRLQQIEQSQGLVERGWRALKSAAKEAWDAMLDVGRATTPEERLNTAKKALEDFDRQGNEPRRGTLRSSGQREALRAQLLGNVSVAESDVREQARNAAASATRAQVVKDYAAAQEANQKWAEAALTNTERMDKALQAYRKNNEAILRGGGSLNDAQVAREEAAIRAKFADKGRTGGAAAVDPAKAIENQIAKRREQAATELFLGEQLSEADRFRVETLRQIDGIQGKIGKTRADDLRRQTTETADLMAKEQSRRELAEADEVVRKRELATRQAAAQLAEREALGLEREVEGLRQSNEEIGLNADGLALLHQRRIDDAIAQKQQELARVQGLTGYESEARAIERQISLLGELRGEAGKRQNKQRDEELRRENDQRRKGISDALLDGLRNGFDGGRKLADAFLDDLVQQFDRTVLRPHLDIMAQGLMSAVDGLVGAIGGGLSGGASSLLSFFGFHSGGVGPNENSFVRVPKFHTGVGPDEMHAVIQKSEGVFTRGQMKAMASLDDVQKALGSSRPSLNYSPTIMVPERSDRATILSDVGRMLKASHAELLEKMERGMV